MSDLFVLQTPLLELVLRAAVIYFFLLLVMRFIGRHEFGQLTPFDLILLLIISESISEAFTAGDTSLLAALVSASTLLGLSVLVSIGQYKSRRFRSIVSPEALKVIENGKVIERSLRRELMTRDELVERLRARGIGGIEEVRIAYIESDGDISALTYRETDRYRAAAAAEEDK
ncbi:DUF421 domain-containing protein [Methanoculleus sp. Wushi-C6]|uniref:DUF421 domain-containing protein n=2 Tax=Methanoculleus caldifontis TaxID=2651577 RepID=A0ABU3X1M8_9EURY|nr:DUF421 domain-containing protein [Methanoculleus sp. Wushi-C6]